MRHWQTERRVAEALAWVTWAHGIKVRVHVRGRVCVFSPFVRHERIRPPEVDDSECVF